MKALSILAFVLGFSGLASAGDCACKEEYLRWKQAKDKVKQVEELVQSLTKDMKLRENKILVLKNQIAALRTVLDGLEPVIDALFAATGGGGNPVTIVGVANAHAQWSALQANLDSLFMQWDSGANPLQTVAGLFAQMAQVIMIATNIQVAEQQGWAAFAGSQGSMAPPVGPFGALVGQLQNYAAQLQKLALAVLDLWTQQVLLDAAKKSLPGLQENLEKARAEEEAARKAYEACLKERHDGKPCDRVVEIAVPTVKEIKLDVTTIDVLSETLLKK